ncbi:VOC family protein [Motilibacter rhizosphaerae]
MVTLDCREVGPVAAFWSEFLGLETVASGEGYAMLKGPDGPAVGFGEVADYAPPAWPNPHGSKQFHFDVAVDDIAEAEGRATALGATLADPQPGETWRVLLDPAGHPFCLSLRQNWG